MCAPLFVHPNGVGHYDWDQHLFYYASVLKSVIEYGQWPFWNPWYCGGNVLWQNPQVALLSPAYPLALIFSLPLAMKLEAGRIALAQHHHFESVDEAVAAGADIIPTVTDLASFQPPRTVTTVDGFTTQVSFNTTVWFARFSRYWLPTNL